MNTEKGLSPYVCVPRSLTSWFLHVILFKKTQPLGHMNKWHRYASSEQMLSIEGDLF